MTTAGHKEALYKIVAVHYLLAGLFFLLLGILFMFSIEALSGHYFQPKILALTHTAALGWGVMIIFGALYQILPVILQKELYSIKLAWASLFFLLPGVILLIYSFWVFRPGLYMQIAGMLLLLAVVLFNVNVFLTVRAKKAESISQEFIVTACIWLSLTVLLGTLMVFNFQYLFISKDHLSVLRLHAHMGIAGWFLMLIIGVSTKLVPMFLVSKYQKTYLLSMSYYFLNIALILFLLDSYLYGLNYKTYFIILLGFMGIGFYIVYIYKCFQSRIRRRLDLPMLKSLLSSVFLVGGIVILPFLLNYHLKHEALAVKLSTFYGVIIFMGWMSMLILGQSFKTLPFIVWLKPYEKLTGKVKTPLPSDLVNNTLLYVLSLSFFLFLFTFIVSFFFNISVLKIIAACSLLLSAIIYLIQLILLFLHQTKTEEYDHF